MRRTCLRLGSMVQVIEASWRPGRLSRDRAGLRKQSRGSKGSLLLRTISVVLLTSLVSERLVQEEKSSDEFNRQARLIEGGKIGLPRSHRAARMRGLSLTMFHTARPSVLQLESAAGEKDCAALGWNVGLGIREAGATKTSSIYAEAPRIMPAFHCQ